ncbi:MULTISPECIES: hypothetical protein [unclassified Myxococcus]|uniref:hypothetical protein n=1 Tax=unclassified Myxococcus TaxID=2648731 RepID=UPI001CBB348F|nr:MULTISPECIES: hypothetical protein [unclassified Myxococcus]MBZ4400718.1 hypothetical protein [Myxococcus sp. AS-1-15]MBZ4413944.1 hypothetical protein [Myxococcus sp. XM-1-1-1]
MKVHERPRNTTHHAEAHKPRATAGDSLESASGARQRTLQRMLDHRPAVQSLLQRQRDADQGARARTSTARPGGVVQRFTEEAGYRISANRAFALPAENETQRFFATPALIERSNRILEAMGSRVRLLAGDDAPEALAGMQSVTPRAVVAEQPLFDVHECIDVADRVTNSGQTHALYQGPDDADLALRRQNPYPGAVGELNLIARELTNQEAPTPQGVVAAQEARFGEDDLESFRFTYGDGLEVETSSLQEASTLLEDAIPSQPLRRALLKNIMKDRYEYQPGFQQFAVEVLTPLIQAGHVGEELETQAGWATRLAQHLDARLADDRNATTTAYRELPEQTMSERSRRIGVNAHARPEVGESYAIVGTRERTAEDPQQLWSFHFAAVIARDGEDSLTLENFNREDDAEGTSRWYFDMQGPEAQSFHAKHQATVAGALTLRMGAPATEELRAQALDRLPEGTSEELTARIQEARTRAGLAAILADATGTADSDATDET